MPTPFNRTLRALKSERSPVSLLVLGLVVLALVLWSAWFLWSRLPVYVVSRDARLEVEEAVNPVVAHEDGRLVGVGVAVGQEVAAGEVLFELEGELERRRLAEETARREALLREIASLRTALATEEQGMVEAQAAAGAAIDEAGLRFQAATAAAELAQEEEERSAKLHERGLLAEMDLRRTRAMASQRASEAAALRQAVARLGRESKREQTDRRAHVDQIAREIAELEGREVTSVAIARRLEEEIARRRIRAPVAGRIGEIAKVRPGSVVAAGDHLATVIPTAQLKVTAAFSPAAALARIAPGQPANLRLDGFPWTSYGTLKATVTRVASEPRQGLLWVDCRIEPASGSRLPRQHGLTGTLAVEVERISPLELALRAAGKAADPRRARTSADG